MLVYTRVSDWRIDSDTRVHDRTNGDKYLLNHKNMFELHDHKDGCWLYYFDNRNDSRCGGAYMRTVNSVALLKARADYPVHSAMWTAAVFPDNDPTATAVNMTINQDQVSRIWPFDRNDSSTGNSWAVYTDDGYDLKKVLVDVAFDDIVTGVGATDVHPH
jgi:hypothetical protein